MTFWSKLIDHKLHCFLCVLSRTGVSVEEGSGATQEQIFERLRLHKEVLQSARQQPWPMQRKVRLVRQAKGYVRRHEGELQERLAHSKTTRDMAARANILVLKVGCCHLI